MLEGQIGPVARGVHPVESHPQGSTGIHPDGPAGTPGTRTGTGTGRATTRRATIRSAPAVTVPGEGTRGAGAEVHSTPLSARARVTSTLAHGPNAASGAGSGLTRLTRTPPRSGRGPPRRRT